MSNELDILSIDANIRKNFEEEFKKLPEHVEKLQEIEESLQKENLRRTVKVTLEKAQTDLKQYIDELESKWNFHFYVIETIPYIEQYKEIIKTPIKVSFMGKPIKKDKEKERVINSFLDAASKNTLSKFSILVFIFDIAVAFVFPYL